LYQFTKTVISLYELDLQQDLDDVYSTGNRPAELEIKTHYEKLDIAGSNKVHYLKFVLNKELPADKDSILKTLISEQENIG
jgi:tRNA (guanine-N7-)-methyltransferase